MKSDAYGQEARTSTWADATVIAVALVLPTITTYLYFVLLAGSELMRVAFAASKIVQFALPLVWVIGVQRVRISFRPPSSKGVVLGLAFGAMVLVAMLVLYFGFLRTSSLLADAPAEVRRKLTQLGCDTPLAFLALAAFYSLGHSFLEEYYWRWFAFGQLARLMPLWPAIVLSSLGFMAHHVIVVGMYIDQWPLVMLFSLCVAVGGAVWAWMYHKSGTLYGPWLSHMLVDAGLMAMGYDMVWGS